MSFSSGDVTKPTATLRFDKIPMPGVVDRVNVRSFMVVEVPKNFWKKKGRELKAVRMIIYFISATLPNAFTKKKKYTLYGVYILHILQKGPDWGNALWGPEQPSQ